MPISPVRLNHAVLFVADLDRSLQFYTQVSAWTSSPANPRQCCVPAAAVSGNHHDLGLFGVGTAGGPKSRGAIGLYHLAWQLDTIDELTTARQALLDAGAYTGESSYGATKSVYGADPDGNEFELMWMLPRRVGPVRAHRHRSPPRPRREVRRWSGVRTAGASPPTPRRPGPDRLRTRTALSALAVRAPGFHASARGGIHPRCVAIGFLRRHTADALASSILANVDG